MAVEEAFQDLMQRIIEGRIGERDEENFRAVFFAGVHWATSISPNEREVIEKDIREYSEIVVDRLDKCYNT